jgi:hypothetical protein
VPNVVGLPQTQAEAAIVNADLTVGAVITAYSDTVPAGNVISQTPAADSPVASGTSVSLIVSLGQPPVTVPNVVGLPQAQAEAAIVNAGLTAGPIAQQNSSTVPAGNVISQDPAAGSSVAPGSAVNLVVSAGPSTLPSSIATFSPVADAFVDEDKPNDNKGTDSSLKVKAEVGKRQISYLRFNPQNLSGNVSRATLYLFARQDANIGVEVRAVADNNWNESTITWQNAPRLGALVRRASPTKSDKWIAIDVTALVKGSGQFSLALLDTVDKNEFRSAQGDRPPLLVVTTSGGNVSAASILEAQPSTNNSNPSTIYLPLVIK